MFPVVDQALFFLPLEVTRVVCLPLGSEIQMTGPDVPPPGVVVASCRFFNHRLCYQTMFESIVDFRFKPSPEVWFLEFQIVLNYLFRR